MIDTQRRSAAALPSDNDTAGPRTPGRRLALVLAVAAAASLGLAVLQLTRGEPVLGVGDAIDVLRRDDSSTAAFLVRELRLPRVLAALLAGALLGASGVLLQDSLRNPLADPSLLGVGQGASFAMALFTFYPEIAPPLPRTAVSLVAGAATGVVVLLIAGRIRDSIRVILVGAVMTGFLGSITSLMILLVPPDRVDSFASYQRFVIGSVSPATWSAVAPLAIWFAVGLPFAIVAGRVLDLLKLGDDAAASAGLEPARARIALMALAMVLVAPAYALVGPIGFVALLAPHMARGALRTTGARPVIGAAAVLGAVQVLGADVLGRLLLFPRELPAGLWTVLIAGPFAVVFVGRLRAAR